MVQMENFTYDNIMLVSLAMLKIAYNFWPVIVFIIGYAVWETYFLRARPISKSAKIPNRDRDTYAGRRHL